MHELALLQNYQFVAAVLFALGLIGFLVRRNMIVMFLCAELMLQGVAVSLVSFSRWHGNWDGQVLVLMIVAVAACEAALALAMILMLVRRSGTLDSAAWQTLREADQPPFLDHAIPEDRAEEYRWPRLTPAGIEQKQDEQEKQHRSHV